MGDFKLLDLLKLNLSVVLQLIGLYLSFLFVVAIKKTAIVGTDFLTIKGIEYLFLTFLVYVIIYVFIQGLLQLGMINFADWVVKKRFKDYTYTEMEKRLEGFGKLLVSITKTNEQMLGVQVGQAFVSTYNYAVSVILITLHVSILLNKIWCWCAFSIFFLFVVLLYLAIFYFKQMDDLRTLDRISNNQMERD